MKNNFLSFFKSKTFPKAAFLFAFAFQLFVTVFQVSKPLLIKNSSLKDNRILKLSCNSFDPYDPWHGRYALLRIDESSKSISELDEESFLDFGAKFSKAYCVFGFDEEKGTHYVKSVRKIKPSSSELFIKTKAMRTYHKEILFKFNFNKYYMQENFSRYVDKMSFQKTKDLEEVLELYVSKSGDVAVKEVNATFEGKRMKLEEAIKIMINR